MARQPNLAASLGGWSARHRLAAISGWLVLVIVTMLIGSIAGQVTMTRAEYGIGESGRAMWLLANNGVAQPAQELVLVHKGQPGHRGGPDSAGARRGRRGQVGASGRTDRC